ncbi:MAG: hypothetical protein U0892_23410 [Pirellulales bacterium]
MHTIDLLEEALDTAAQMGFQVRHESLGGNGGGACRLGKRYMLFVDRSLTAAEQLEQALGALRAVVQADGSEDVLPNLDTMSVELKRCLVPRSNRATCE